MKDLGRCERCFFLKEANLKVCRICGDPKRDREIVAIIEKETDLLFRSKSSAPILATISFWGNLAEKGVLETAQKLRLEYLKSRIKRARVAS